MRFNASWPCVDAKGVQQIPTRTNGPIDTPDDGLARVVDLAVDLLQILSGVEGSEVEGSAFYVSTEP